MFQGLVPLRLPPFLTPRLPTTSPRGYFVHSRRPTPSPTNTRHQSSLETRRASLTKTQSPLLARSVAASTTLPRASTGTTTSAPSDRSRRPHSSVKWSRAHDPFGRETETRVVRAPPPRPEQVGPTPSMTASSKNPDHPSSLSIFRRGTLFLPSSLTSNVRLIRALRPGVLRTLHFSSLASFTFLEMFWRRPFSTLG